MEIKDWFKTKDFETGVELYKATTRPKRVVLKQLEKGKSRTSLSLLIRELRQAMKFDKPEVVYKPKSKVKTKSQTTEQPKQDPDVREASAKEYFKSVSYAELPPELKQRYRLLKDLFYDMCDLKLELNDLPAKAEDQALKIQIEIDKLDQKKQLIWDEIDYFKNTGKLLKQETDIDLKSMEIQAIILKKASLQSSIYHMNKRLKTWKTELESTQNADDKRNLESQIHRTTNKKHKHEMTIKQIEDFLG